MCKIYFLFVFVIVAFVNIKAQTVYPSLNVNLLAHLDPEKDVTGAEGRKYSGCWGWYQSVKNKEYAIIGTSSQTYFIDVTIPTNPIIVDSVKARRSGCTWREIKTYQNYCYIVSDDGSPNSFQIIDMQYLPDSVHVAYDGTTYFERCHTIFIDNDKLYCGAPSPVGQSYDNMRVYSLATPTAPLLLRTLSQDISGISFAHDMFVRNDTVYASCGGQGLQIYKFNTSTNTFSQLTSYTGYPYAGYNHSSWQTDNRKTMVFADEVPNGLPAKVIDVSDFGNITLMDTIRSNFGATAHNPYIVGNNWCWMSTYHDGIYLYDISNPSDSKIYGYFDTYTQSGIGNTNTTYSGYKGNWGAYPYLPSKIIITCDMQNGIFILDGDSYYKTGIATQVSEYSSTLFNAFPFPASNEIQFVIANQQNKKASVLIIDAIGKKMSELILDIHEPLFKTSINTENLANGIYFLNLVGPNLNETKKIIIQH